MAKKEGKRMDQETLKTVFGGKDYDVNIITTAHEGHVNGQAATWVTQVSMGPPLFAVCLAPERYTCELIEESRILAVNMLAQDQAELVPAFGYRSGRDVDKFAEVKYTTAKTGSPIIEGVAAYLDCRVKAVHPAGDHKIYVVEVVEAGVGKEGPRLSYQWLLSQTTAA